MKLKPKTCICHQLNPESNSMSKQASFHELFLKECGYEVVETPSKGVTPFALNSLIGMIQNLQTSDILHVHACSWWGFLPALYGAVATKITDKRMILTYHGGLLEDFHRKCFFLFWFLDKDMLITVPSAFLKRIFLYMGFTNVKILENVVDDVFFDVGNLREGKPLNKNIIVARHFERIYKVKNAIIAFGELSRHYPSAKLFLLGSGSQENSLRILVKKMKIKNVHFFGRVPNKEMPTYYSRVSIMINPTSVDNAPVSVLEAFASGLVIISTDAGGLTDIIDDKKDGFLVRKNDPNDILNKIRFVLQNPEFATNVSEAGRKKALKKNSKQAVMNKLAKIYDNNTA